MKMDQQKIHDVVTQICDLGCTRIRQLIASMESGVALHETGTLNTAECQTVLAELKSIVAICDLLKYAPLYSARIRNSRR